MRVALISFANKNDDASSRTVKALAEASQGNGNQVDMIDGNEDLTNTRLTVYDYIAVVVRPRGIIGGKIAPRVGEFLAASGNVVSKKGCALVLKGGLSSEKTCRNLMKAMEGEGIKLDYFNVVRDSAHARLVGKKIG
jgi:hypothetical protein